MALCPAGDPVPPSRQEKRIVELCSKAIQTDDLDESLGSIQDLLGNAFIRRSHHFLKYIGGVLKPI